MVRLKDLRGKKVALYFYPKDDTPGCTKEACAFRDSFVSSGSAASRCWEFRSIARSRIRSSRRSMTCLFAFWRTLKEKLSDEYGTYGEKKFMGRKYMGNHRMTFLIDEKGKIKKIYEKVKPDDHAEEVLAAFRISVELANSLERFFL